MDLVNRAGPLLLWALVQPPLYGTRSTGGSRSESTPPYHPPSGQLKPAGLRRLFPLPLAVGVQISGGGERRWLGAVAEPARVHSQFPRLPTARVHCPTTAVSRYETISPCEARRKCTWEGDISHWRMQNYPQ